MQKKSNLLWVAFFAFHFYLNYMFLSQFAFRHGYIRGDFHLSIADIQFGAGIDGVSGQLWQKVFRQSGM